MIKEEEGTGEMEDTFFIAQEIDKFLMFDYLERHFFFSDKIYVYTDSNLTENVNQHTFQEYNFTPECVNF